MRAVVCPSPVFVRFGAPEKQAALRKHYERMTELNYTPEWVRANPEAFQRIVTRSMTGRRPFRALMAHSGAVGLFDTSTRLHKISIPTLVVHGDKDAVLPIENGRKVAAMVSNRSVRDFPCTPV
jgi:pimeloyl-ACP methyl ester carboxylesterase